MATATIGNLTINLDGKVNHAGGPDLAPYTLTDISKFQAAILNLYKDCAHFRILLDYINTNGIKVQVTVTSTVYSQDTFLGGPVTITPGMNGHLGYEIDENFNYEILIPAARVNGDTIGDNVITFESVLVHELLHVVQAEKFRNEDKDGDGQPDGEEPNYEEENQKNPGVFESSLKKPTDDAMDEYDDDWQREENSDDPAYKDDPGIQIYIKKPNLPSQTPPMPQGDTDKEKYKKAAFDLLAQAKEPPKPTDDDIQACKDKVAAGQADDCPLVFDLNGDGLSLTHVSDLTKSVYFNLDNDEDEFAEATGWIASDNGLLAIDLDGNGRIDNGGELFGDAAGHENGFLALAEYDSNDDGQIDSGDAAWDDLVIWIDEVADGISSTEELYTLDELNITSINLEYSLINLEVNGNAVRQKSSFVIGGQSRDVYDVFFDVDYTNSFYEKDFVLDAAALYLPNARGYGKLPYLMAAISEDNDTDDPDSLISRVTELSQKNFTELLIADDSILVEIENILYRWAGVEDVVPGSRGPYFDAQKLAFLEILTGESFLQAGHSTIPMSLAPDYLSTAYDLALNHFYAVLLAQTAAVQIFDGQVSYDFITDTYDGLSDLSLTTLAALEVTAVGLASTPEKEVFWANVVRLIEYSIGIDNLSGGDETALADAISDSGVTLTLTELVDGLVYSFTYSTVAGTSGADSLVGGIGRDFLNGGTGDDTLAAGGGVDTVDGSWGNDTLIGGTAEDKLEGGIGNDVYAYTAGDGVDVIAEFDGTDKILFDASIDVGDVALTRSGDDLVIDIDNGVYQGQIYVSGQFTHQNFAVETLDFNGGSTITVASVQFTLEGKEHGEILSGANGGGDPDDIINGNGGNDRIIGAAGNDTLHGNEGADYIDGGLDDDALYGDNGNDKLLGYFGNDTLSGGAGNDILYGGYGANTLDGGAGNDTLIGSNGADRYEYSGGKDIIREIGGVDDIYLASGLNEADVHYYRSGSDLQIFFSLDDNLTIKNYYAAPAYKVEYLHFNGGSTVDLSGIFMFVQGTESADTITGGTGNDDIQGRGGNDVLDGYTGNDYLAGGLGNDTVTGGTGDDQLEGGAGNDSLYGDAGDDTFIFTSGNDFIQDSGNTDDVLQFINGWSAEDASYICYLNNVSDLVVYFNASNSITLDSQLVFDDNYKIDSLVFEDGTVDPFLQPVTLMGSAGADLDSDGIDTWATPYLIAYGLGGNDTITTNDGDDTLYGGEGNDTMSGAFGADYIDGGEGDDTLAGGYGDDTLYYAEGVDFIIEVSGGGSGTDTLVMSSDWSINDFTGIRKYAASGNDGYIELDGSSTVILDDWFLSGSHRIEYIQFDDGTIDLSDPASYSAIIAGTAGVDTLAGTTGDDSIDGLAGADTMSGGNGDDTYIVDDASDVVSETSGAGTDIIYTTVPLVLGANLEDLILIGSSAVNGTGNTGNNTLRGNSAANSLIGGTGNDTYIWEDTADTLVENAAEGTDTVVSTLTYTLLSNFENLTLYGDEAINGTGNSGNNTLTGNSAANTLAGGTGDDTYVVSDLLDTLTENSAEGTDTVLASIIYTLGANIENLTLSGSDNLNGTGNSGVNVLTGNSGNNSLDGAGGADTMLGGQGNDVYMVDNASDVVTESASQGTDTVYASVSYTISDVDVENITLTGIGNINATGNSSANTLTANAGINTLAGGGGNDVYFIDSASDVVTENSAEGTDTVNSSVSYTITDTDVENLTLAGTDNINATGNTSDNTLTGNSGTNTLTGGTGNDTYVVDSLSDTLVEAAAAGTDTVLSSISWTLATDFENLTLSGSSNIDGTGTSGVNTLIGNTGNNTLDGGAGNDSMAGGAGDDTFVVDSTSDTLTETSGTDTVLSSVNWTLATGFENLTLTGSAVSATGNTAVNIIIGNGSANVINAGTGTIADTMDGAAGADSMTGGDGNDTYYVDNAGDVVTETTGANSGTDTVISSITYTLAGTNLEHLTLTGSGTINGTGNASANTLTGGSGTNTLTGSTGNDTYVVSSANHILVENAAEGTDLVQSSITWTLATDFENLTLTGSSNINATGNSVVNTINGNTGNNTIDGGAGADTMIGGTGNDYYFIDNGSDVITESASAGTDTAESSVTFTIGSTIHLESLILTGAGNINATGNSLDNTLTGNGGTNTLSGSTGDDLYYVSTGDVVVEGSFQGTDTVVADVNYTITDADVENLTLSGSAVSATGNSSVNIITGTSGNNTLDGSTGADTLIGGTGDDTYIVDNASDVITENASAGTDLVSSTATTYTLSDNVENLTLAGVSNIHGVGNSAVNTLTGNSGNNSLDGGAGADTLIGGAGNDTYVVDTLSDVLTETSGTDTVLSSISWTLATDYENLTLSGSGNINATGNSGTNTLTGNIGNNTLDGSTGNDRYFGGAGNDTYMVDGTDTVTEAANEGTDIVISSVTFTLGTDVENLTLTGSSNLNGTGNASDNVITGNTGNNSLNGGAGADTLTGGTGTDTLVGSTGDDLYIIDSSDTVTESAAQGTDTVMADFTYTLGTNVENLTLTGSSNITGTGNTGNNTIVGNSGTNTLIGGTGDDTYYVDGSDVVTENASEGTDTVIAAETWTLGSNIENLTLIGYDDADGTGNTLNNVITGNEGINTLSGSSGADTLDGGLGVDTLVGGTGDDIYIIDNVDDVITENASEGTDTAQASVSYTISAEVENATLTGSNTINIVGNASVNILTGNNNNNTLDGSTGADTLVGEDGDDTYIVDNASDIVTETASEGTDHVQSSVSWTLGSDTENLTLTGASAINGTGNSVGNTIAGNEAVNTLSGSGGADTLDGGEGADTLIGGTGDDVMIVDNTSDVTTESAAEGTDTVESSIDWTLGSEIENLTLTGEDDIDGTGNSGVNTITGNDGDNTLDGSTGADTMAGGEGDDAYVVDNASDVITETSGTDSVSSSVTYTLAESVENITLTGAGTINATGNTGNNSLTGNSGANSLVGGNGDDTYVWDDATDTIVESADEGTDTVRSSLTLTLGSNLENLVLTGASTINGTGNSLDNVITGNSAVNTLTGSGGADTLDGGASADTLIGGTGDDTYVVDNASDTLTENSSEGTDTVESELTWTLASNFENLVLTGSSAINGTGNSADNIITGNDAVNTLTGSGGADTLDGDDGDDTLIGGTGDDIYVVDSTSDVVTESTSEGTDTVESYVDWTLATDFENLTLLGSSEIDGTGNSVGNVITGNSAVNTLTGSGGADTLDGGFGADTLVGGTGDDILIIDDEDDVVTENSSEGTDTVKSAVTWTLASHFENLTLTGEEDVDGTGNSVGNILIGNTGVNTLSGDSGADTLDGGGGLDSLTGGANADTFLFSLATAYSDIVTVTDFSTGQTDVIDLGDLLTEYDPMTEVLTDFVMFADAGGNTAVSVDRDGLGVTYGWTQVATLTGVTGLTNEAALVSSGNLVVS